MELERKLHLVKQMAVQVRDTLAYKYNNNFFGKCIEASDLLVDYLRVYKIPCKAIRVYCLYENFESCSDYCFEEHWLVEVLHNNKPYIYIDTTMSQFQWAFSRKLPDIYLSSRLPKFYLLKKPNKRLLDLCGWNDWYNTGDYINNFDYWG